MKVHKLASSPTRQGQKQVRVRVEFNRSAEGWQQQIVQRAARIS